VVSPQLLPHCRRQKRLQLGAGAAEVHGEARLERVAQLAEGDALLVSPLSLDSAIARRGEAARGGGEAEEGQQ